MFKACRLLHHSTLGVRVIKKNKDHLGGYPGANRYFSVNSHTNTTRIGWHLWEIELRLAPGLSSG